MHGGNEGKGHQVLKEIQGLLNSCKLGFQLANSWKAKEERQGLDFENVYVMPTLFFFCIKNIFFIFKTVFGLYQVLVVVCGIFSMWHVGSSSLTRD